MAERWILSADLLDFIAERYHRSGRYANFDVAQSVAEDAVLKRLASSALRSRASRGRLKTGDPFGDETVRDFNEQEIPVTFWHGLRLSEADDREIDWVLGDFSFASGFGEHCYSGQAFNVFFEVSAMSGAASSVEANHTAQSAEMQIAGRPPKYDWPAAVLAIFGLIYRGELRPSNQADIERALLSHLTTGKVAPSESTVRPYAKQIWDEYLKA